ncbi:kinase-like domain-containing protein, partial [Melanogaster broomeanus]
LRRELGIWRRLNHPNIVPFLGIAYAFGSGHFPCMVSMWMSNGTLTSYIKKCGTELALSNRLQLVEGIATGLEYLHSQNIVHGDLHPMNVLIDSEHNARLTDFGFTQVLGSVQEPIGYLQSVNCRPGAMMWAALELFSDSPSCRLEITVKSDIYSLGSIMLFVFSGKRPWPSLSNIQQNLRSGLNPERPTSPTIPDDIWRFIEKCWSPSSLTTRPSAEEVI